MGPLFRKLRILVTNDDGYRAMGIRSLYRELAIHHEVIVAAPETEQSGIGHAFTYSSAILCKVLDETTGLKGFSVNGTPSDCVKLALAELLPEKPDIVVSGINAGENTGMAVYYSGTMAGAREAAFWGLHGVAFSMSDGGECYLPEYADLARMITEKIADMPAGERENRRGTVYYNVNFPACPVSSCGGIRAAGQSLAFFNDRYRMESEDKDGKHYRLCGGGRNVELTKDFDTRALMENHVVITPLMFDATEYEHMHHLKNEIEQWKY
jgi:5'-nucleotidase